jgi:hypothetical protein
MPNLDDELLSGLDSVESATAKSPCKCQDQSDAMLEDTLGTMPSDPDLELDAALDALSSTGESGVGLLTSMGAEDELEFADLAQDSDLQLKDLLSLVEKYPGLKITFSY